MVLVLISALVKDSVSPVYGIFRYQFERLKKDKHLLYCFNTNHTLAGLPNKGIRKKLFGFYQGKLPERCSSCKLLKTTDRLWILLL